MYKVFLAEDEYIIRDAIRRTVDWNGEGFELVGEAGDGERAYGMILDAKPDILITDIRMPFMDGLELSRLVRKKLPQTRIVILSGYDDFRYAKEAITIGVTEYLLKPVSGAKLLETLKKVASGIEADRRKEDYKEIYEAEHEERIKFERQDFIRRVIDGKIGMTEAVEAGQAYSLSLPSEWYGVVMMQLCRRESDSSEPDDESGTISEAVTAIVDTAEQKPYIGLYEQIGGVLVMLIMADGRQELKERTREEIRFASQTAGGDPEVLFFASVGKPCARLSGIPASADEANRRFARRFRMNSSRIFSWEDAPEETEQAQAKDGGIPGADATFSLSDFDIGKMDRKVIFHFLRSGSSEETGAFVQECFSSFGPGTLDSQLVRQYVVMDAYLTTASFLNTLGLSTAQTEEVLGKLADPARITSRGDVSAYLSELFTKALKERDRRSEQRYGSIVSDAKQFIYRNFTQNNLSLGKVAEAVGVSSNHLSRLFSQTAGCTFVEFLTDVRMEKARDLLLTTDIASSEIGLMVGYSDPHYFYYLFKKTQGMTPKEFRSENGNKTRQ